ncbi:hypothetical protein GSI_05786 [Ganoderma sinense ZZ0214-1]|uniref:F-box domain-containing protein n=1 Tax=Ganoderma sinense ZZ0214-1 TaxID=1077348 RepID=A0A2G8SBF7_9APHY|nr:hypothetical protein GSI_05786 [Ganoderma sinense ZZ0214-1]
MNESSSSSREIWKTGSWEDHEAADSEKGHGMHSYERYTDPHEEPRLNFDILRLLCDYLTDIPDVLSFALICSALTEDALRRRLQMAPVHLSNAKVVKSFHTFIFSNQLSRAPCIYGLKIPSSEAYYGLKFRGESDIRTIETLLVAILETAVHLHYLDFRTSISSFVFDAMVQMTTVHELWILADASLEVSRTRIASFQSLLRSLHISGSDVPRGTVSASFLHDHLRHFAPTIELLELDCFLIDLVPASITTQFSAVRSLEIKAPLIYDFDLLEVLLRLFPKLDHMLTLGSFRPRLGEDDTPAFRERSKQAQRAHAWSRLDRLVCDAETTHFIALKCPIRRMDIEVNWSGAAQFLANTLRHQSPQQLHIRLSLFDGFGTLDVLFPLQVAAKLTHLVIFVDIEVRHGRRSGRRQDDIVRSRRFLNRLVSSIKHLRLTHLRVVFHYSVYLFMRKAVLDARLGDVGAADGMDLRLAAERFSGTIPTLRYVFLTTCGQTHATPTRKRWSEFRTQMLQKWHSSKAWRVVRAQADEELHPSDSDVELGPGSCVELSGEAGERIVHREGLELSRREQDKVQVYNGSNG